MLENNAPAEYQQAPRRLPPKDVQNEILQNLRRYAEQFMLNPAEFEVAGFMTLTTANLEIDPLSTEFALASVYHMVYLRQFGPFVSRFDTPEKRAAFVQNLPAEDAAALRTQTSDEDEAYETLLADPAPNMFTFLAPFSLHHLMQYFLMQEEGENTYRTRRRAGDTVLDIPKNLAVPTLKNYQYTMSLTPAGNAYMQPLASTDGLKFSGGRMYFKGNDIQPVSEVELQNMVTKEGIESIDLGMLRIFYSIILREFEKTKYSNLQDVIKLYIPDLAESMGLQRNINKAGIQRLIETIQSFHNIVGVMHGTRAGKPSKSLYPVLNFEGYDDKKNTISFSSPYMNMVIQTVYRLAIVQKKDGAPKLTRRGDPVRNPTHSYGIKTSILKERNKAAIENVVTVVQLIEQCGDQTPHISARTMIERNPQLATRLEKVKNPTSLLKRTFEATWKLLREQTYLSEWYQDIQLPDPSDPAVIPSLKTLDSMVFTFSHNGKRKN